jgi:hypothetical protein
MKPEAWAPNQSNFTKFVARDQLRVKQVTEIFVLTSRMQAFAWCFVCKVFHTANRWEELRQVRDWLSPFLGLHCTRSLGFSVPGRERRRFALAVIVASLGRSLFELGFVASLRPRSLRRPAAKINEAARKAVVTVDQRGLSGSIRRAWTRFRRPSRKRTCLLLPKP